MTIHPARVAAAVLLGLGGFVVAVTAFAIALSTMLVNAGLSVRPADAAILMDLASLVPLIAGFAVVTVVAAGGLLAGRAWADAVALSSSAVAIAVGVIGLLLIGIGEDPLASSVSARSTSDGFGIVGVFTLLYIAVFVAVSIADRSTSRSMGAAA
jgi:hypothetical protein